MGLGHNDNSKDIMYPVETSEVVINGFKFTSTTALTDITRQKLAAHYAEAFKDFSVAAAPKVQQFPQVQQAPAQQDPQLRPNAAPVQPVQAPAQTIPVKVPQPQKW